MSLKFECIDHRPHIHRVPHAHIRASEQRNFFALDLGCQFVQAMPIPDVLNLKWLCSAVPEARHNLKSGQPLRSAKFENSSFGSRMAKPNGAHFGEHHRRKPQTIGLVPSP